ncbi:MAG: HNH endonuclease [Gloeocapsa sp. UFS-A4-WI-NPMV-4B04]|nr:HNH endonuclease [Gloeocapsa sp. UFS-A4-WI-NPMV-4B04]
MLLFVEERQLTIELVPNTCWYSNVRSNVSKQDWDNLRHYTYKQAGHRCEVCGGVGQQHPVECHEIWNYDDQQHIQTLTGLIALCPACHECKHIGLAQIKDRGEIALQHLAKVNKWSLEQAEEYASDCFKIWHRRSQFNWKLDISYLKQFGICTDVELDRNN